MKKIYYNGSIITVNDAQPSAEALMVDGDKIAAVGSLEEVTALKDDATEMIDLEGKTMLPGFIDGHSHIGNIMAGLPQLYPPPNGDIDSKKKLLAALKKMIDNGELLENGWLFALGYDNAFFENEAHPTRDELDQISTEIPMVVLQVSGHIGTVNSKALEIVGWTKESPNPEGGVLQHDPITGELNGIIEERAIHVLGFGHVLKGVSLEELAKLFRHSQVSYAQNGVTTAQEGGTTKEFLETIRYVQSHEGLLIDVISYPMQDYLKDIIPDDTSAQSYHNRLKIAGAKVVADGSPQGKTAWLTKPYYKVPAGAAEDYKGYPIFSDEQMLDFCTQALEHDWQMLVHCNGDATGDQFIRCYKKAQEATGNYKNLRPVMIHAQTVREDQLDEMKELGMTPSFFHDHVFYWGDYHYESVLGPERGSRISPLASCVKREMPFTLHNDVPVTPINPIFNIHNAVNRITRGGRALGTEYCVDVMEAVKAVTIYGAYQHFDEDTKGSLEVGKRADIVILDKNPLKVDKTTIKDIKVVETIKDGNVIYKA